MVVVTFSTALSLHGKNSGWLKAIVVRYSKKREYRELNNFQWDVSLKTVTLTPTLSHYYVLLAVSWRSAMLSWYVFLLWKAFHIILSSTVNEVKLWNGHLRHKEPPWIKPLLLTRLTLLFRRPARSFACGWPVTGSCSRTRWGRRSAPEHRTPSRRSSWRRSCACRCSMKEAEN